MIEKVRTRSFLLMVAHSLVIGGNAGAHFILAALLSPDIYGSVFFFITALNFILMAAMLGFSHVIMHQAPRLEAQKNTQALNDLVYDSWNICVVLGFALALLFALWHFLVMPIPMPGASGAVLCLLFIAPLWAFIRIALPFLLSRGATFAGVLPDQGVQALGLVLMPLLFYVGWGSLESVPFLLSGQIALGVVSVIVIYIYVRRYFMDLGSYHFRFIEPLKKWRNLNLPFFAFSLSQQAVQRSDLILIGVLAGPAELAIYAVALKLAQILNFPAMASKAALAPRFSMLFGEGNTQAVQKLLLSGTVILGGIGVLSGTVLYFLSPFILQLIGDVYVQEGLKILFILIVAEVLVCVFTPLKIRALMGTYQKFLSVIFFLGLVVSIIFNVHYIPLYGIEAAALIRLAVMVGIHVLMGASLMKVSSQTQ